MSSEQDGVQQATQRVQQISLARTLIKRKKFDKALRILKDVRTRCSDSMASTVDTLIQNVEQQIEQKG